MSKDQLAEILNAEAAIKGLVTEIANYSSHAQQLKHVKEDMQRAIDEVNDVKKDLIENNKYQIAQINENMQSALAELKDNSGTIKGLSAAAEKALKKRVDELMFKTESAAQKLNVCIGREGQEVINLKNSISELHGILRLIEEQPVLIKDISNQVTNVEKEIAAIFNGSSSIFVIIQSPSLEKRG